MNLRKFLSSRLGNLSIGVTLVMATTVPAMIMFLALSWSLYQSGKENVFTSINQQGEIISSSLSEVARYGVISGNIKELKLIANQFMRASSSIAQIRIYDVNGKVLVDDDLRSHLTDVITFSASIVQKDVSMNTSEMFELGASNINQNPSPHFSTSRVIGYVEVVVSPASLWTEQRERIYFSFGAMLFVAVLSCMLGASMVHRIRVTFAEVLDVLRNIRRQDFSVKFNKYRTGDLGEIQKAIRDMAQSLSKTQTDLERQVQDRTVELQAALVQVARSDNERQRLIKISHERVEEERKRIASDIHDQINASLIGLKLQSQVIQELANTAECTPEDMKGIAAAAKAINATVEPLYGTARAIIKQLRPEVLETLGLTGALGELMHNYNNPQDDRQFQLHISRDFPELPAEQSIAVYRVIQEALNNIVKHADAKNIRVSLKVHHATHHACVEINDDGRGFDVSSPTASNSFGLIGMRERVLGLDGQLLIESRPGQGTRLWFTFPLPTKNESHAHKQEPI